MDRTRRRILAGIGTTGLVSLAGCSALDFAVGTDSLSFEADTAMVAETAVSEAGYSEATRSTSTVERTFGPDGESRTVEVTNQVVEYDRSVSILGQELRWGLFAVLSTPQVDVLGRAFNPVADMDTDALAEMIQQRYDRISNVERDSTRPVDVLGETVEVVSYRAEGQFTEADLRIEMTLHVTPAIAAGDDFVVCLGAHPRRIDETDEINRLLGGVDHPESDSSSTGSSDSTSTDGGSASTDSNSGSASNSSSDSESDTDLETNSTNSSESGLLPV